MSFPIGAINTVNFPGLGFQFNINSVAFSIGSINVYWYGIIIGVAVLLAYIYAVREARRTGFDENIITDILLIGLPSAIIFARLYYVAFKWEDYSGDLMGIFRIWEGGIAIYGAVIGAVVSALIYCFIKKVKFMRLADIAAPSLLIGQSIGRWGNFVNVEAFGTETDLPWRMGIVEAGEFIYVHPTFLYESLWNLAGLVLILSLRKRKPFTGFLFWLYLLWYGAGRFFIEGLRTDSLMLGNARISQIVALVCVIVSAIVIAMNWSKGIDEEELEDLKKAAATDSKKIEENDETAETGLDDGDKNETPETDVSAEDEV